MASASGHRTGVAATAAAKSSPPVNPSRAARRTANRQARRQAPLASATVEATRLPPVSWTVRIRASSTALVVRARGACSLRATATNCAPPTPQTSAVSTGPSSGDVAQSGVPPVVWGCRRTGSSSIVTPTRVEVIAVQAITDSWLRGGRGPPRSAAASVVRVDVPSVAVTASMSMSRSGRLARRWTDRGWSSPSSAGGTPAARAPYRRRWSAAPSTPGWSTPISPAGTARA